MSNSDRGRPPSDYPPSDLRKQRDDFLQNFAKGSRLSEEFVQELERVQRRLTDLEAENAQLRATVERDVAVRELLDKIRMLEHEKTELLSRFREAQQVSTQFSERFQQVELEFANLANLFVASNQLHSSLSPRGVTRRIKEVLAQLVGAESYCVYLANAEATELVPIASEGVPGDKLVSLPLGDTDVGEVFRKGAPELDEARDPSAGSFERPAAVLPLKIDDKVVGLVAIFRTLSQKTKFDTIDFELFRMLGEQAAAALVSASLFAQAERKLPGLEAFLDLSV